MLEKERVLFDTNVYGLIAETKGASDFLEKIADAGIIVCGSKVIRDELRKIPLSKTAVGRNLRSLCLELYDSLVKEKRNYSVTTFVEELATEYAAYHENTKSRDEIKNDFLIVATSSLHHVDIVCSEDSKTMSSKESTEIYSKVNKKYELPTPKFIKIKELRQLVKWSV